MIELVCGKPILLEVREMSFTTDLAVVQAGLNELLANLPQRILAAAGQLMLVIIRTKRRGYFGGQNEPERPEYDTVNESFYLGQIRRISKLPTIRLKNGNLLFPCNDWNRALDRSGTRVFDKDAGPGEIWPIDLASSVETSSFSLLSGGDKSLVKVQVIVGLSELIEWLDKTRLDSARLVWQMSRCFDKKLRLPASQRLINTLTREIKPNIQAMQQIISDYAELPAKIRELIEMGYGNVPEVSDLAKAFRIEIK